jgi:streptomycin 6-kinase
MLVQVFPYDRRLPSLCRVMSEASRFLEPLLLARHGSGQWQVEERDIHPTRYRTELGAALRYTMRARDAVTARSETLRCYLKVYRSQRGEGMLERLQSLSARAGNGRNLYSVVSPIAYLRELRTLVLEEGEGTSLQQLLLTAGDRAAAVRLVAKAVAAFNQDRLAITRHHSLIDQFDDLKQASSLVQWACPEMRAEARAITAAVIGGLKEVPPAPIHRDLKPDHIFLNGDRVIFIDLDSVALGDPVRDPAHLFAYIAAGVGLDSMPPEQARAAAAALVEEYFAHVPKPWRKSFPTHCAGALIEVAGGIFRRQEPQWREKLTECVEEAQRVLEGGLR